MRKKWIPFLFAGLLSLTIVSCGSAGRDEQRNEQAAVPEQAEDQKTDETGTLEPPETPEDDGFSLAEIKNLEFYFSSGAGAWCTTLQIHGDGSFEGQYHDSDMGSHGEGYPNGTVYQSNFSGQFTTPVKVNDYTYSMQIARMDYEQETGSEEIRDGVLYSFTDAYGLEEAQDILIYLPGTPLSDLSEEFLIWMNGYDLTENGDIC